MAKYLSIIVYLFTIVASAQDSLCVFKTKGATYGMAKNGLYALKKGTYIKSKSKVILDENSGLLTIDENGLSYQLDSKGTYEYATLVKAKTSKNKAGLTSKYFKIIWDEMRNKKQGSALVGGVFRGEKLMLFPQDDAKIASSKLVFSWKAIEDASNYYIFIRHPETDDILKMATTGTELTLYKNQPYFEGKSDLEWVVSTEEFPNLNNLPFNTFKLISKNDYRDWLDTQADLISELKNLGMTEDEITQSLCETYAVCRD